MLAVLVSHDNFLLSLVLLKSEKILFDLVNRFRHAFSQSRVSDRHISYGSFASRLGLYGEDVAKSVS